MMAEHVTLLEPGTTRKHSLMCERRTDSAGVVTWWCSVDSGKFEPTSIDGGKAIHEEVQDATPSAIGDLVTWFSKRNRGR